MIRLNIEFDGKTEKVLAFRKGAELWFHLRGETHFVDLRPKTAGRAKGAADDSGELLAPMPGRILKVPAQVGTQVKAGETLVVMEAMKMEYTLKAPADGKVAQVFCKESDQVGLHQHLVTVEKAVGK